MSFVNVGLSHRENERKEVFSFRYTPLSWFTAFVVGKKLVVVSEALNENKFLLWLQLLHIHVQTASRCVLVQLLHPTAHFLPTSHLPDHLLAQLSSK